MYIYMYIYLLIIAYIHIYTRIYTCVYTYIDLLAKRCRSKVALRMNKGSGWGELTTLEE